jgi:hypothetical protein
MYRSFSRTGQIESLTCRDYFKALSRAPFGERGFLFLGGGKENG